jgi:L-lactate dehydrogenase complex protein LldE
MDTEERDIRPEGAENGTPPPPPARVILYPTCLVDSFFPGVGEASVHLIERVGAEVIVPDGLTCCGLPLFNNGFPDEARKALETQMDLLGGEAPIVVPSGSCAWMLRCVLPTLFPEDPWLRSKAERIASRVQELSQFLGSYGGCEPGVHLPGKTVYHDSCHLLRGLGEREAPRRLLDGACERREEMTGADRCCGFGGSFAVKFPEVSCAMLDEKIGAAEKAGANWMVAADAGCILQIGCGLSKRGSKIRLLHLAQALAGPNAPGWPDSDPPEERAP